MKNIFRFLFVAFCLFSVTNPLHAQFPSWTWAKSAGGSDYQDWAKSVAVDASGNIYVAGGYQAPTITFGSFTLTNVSSSGWADVFVVKYSPNGTVLWAKSAGSLGDRPGELFHDYAESVTADASGNILVAGEFSGSTITFGSITLRNSGYNTLDLFLVKYDASGNVLWATSAGGNDYPDWVHTVTTDASGNIFMAGWFFSSTITFGSITLRNSSYPNYGYSDMFLVKYDANGNLRWAKSAGGSNYYDAARSVTADGSGNVFLVGGFTSPTITFGSLILTNSVNSPSATPNTDMFLVKYDATGNVLWAKSAGGSNHSELAYSVTADGSGNIFVAGNFYSTTVNFGTITLTNSGGNDAFLVKYDNSGNVLWANSAGGSVDEFANSVTTDVSGNVFVAGNFYSTTMTFGSFTLPGGNDIFVTKYDNSGNVLWAKGAGGNNYFDCANSVAADAAGNIFVAGDFYCSTFTFGSIKLTNSGSTGDWSDIYLAKLSSITGVQESNCIPREFYLSQNYPNPFNPSTRISYAVPKTTRVRLSILDALGREVGLLVNGERAAGIYEMQWEAGSFPSGIYFYRLQAGKFVETKKMILLK